MMNMLMMMSLLLTENTLVVLYTSPYGYYILYVKAKENFSSNLIC